jgi:lipid-binding SYLF domain-containing protein
VFGFTRNEVTTMNIKRLAMAALVQIALAALLVLPAFAQFSSAPLAPKASVIDQEVSAALSSLYANNQTASALGARAKAILVFPNIRKGAFLVGAQYGFGSLLEGGTTVGYYRTAAASYGFQAGVKQFGYALFFMTNSAVSYLNTSGGWAIGTGPSLVVVDQGVARSLTTTNLRSDVYAFVFNQEGLMGGIGVEGSKVTRITPNM